MPKLNNKIIIIVHLFFIVELDLKYSYLIIDSADIFLFSKFFLICNQN